MSPIVIPDDGDKSMKFEAHDAQRPSLRVRQQDAIIIIDDSSDEEEGDMESQAAGATHTQQGDPQIRMNSHAQDPEYQRRELQQLHTLLQVPPENINAFEDSDTVDSVPFVAPTLVPQQNLIQLPPVIPVSFKFLTISTVEGEEGTSCLNGN